MSTAGRRFLPRRVEYAFVVVIIGAMAAVIVPAVRSVQDPRGPNGRKIPVEHPDPARRVDHSSGLSIVLPVNWEIRSGSPEMMIIDPRVGARRAPSRLTVWALQGEDVPPQLEGYQRVEFQGLPAYEKCFVEKKDGFDDPAYSRYLMYVERDNQWYCVNFGIQGTYRELPLMIREYINTIRWPMKKSS